MKQRRIATVGTFDGVHLGHRAVLDTLAAEGKRRDELPLIITFRTHPLCVVAPERAPQLLITAEEKMQILGDTGMEVLMLDFTPQLCSLTAKEWMQRLHDDFDVSTLVVGYDNTFGSDGKQLPRERFPALGREVGLEVIEAPCLPGVSSSAVRRALQEGDMPLAASMLGHRFSLTGKVVHGHHLGRTLGFPTANIQVAEQQLLPKPGVYAVIVGAAENGLLPGVVNIGRRPTVETGGMILPECHIPGLTGDLYGKRLTLHFIRRMRDEQKFSDLDHLKAAIAADCRAAIAAAQSSEL